MTGVSRGSRGRHARPKPHRRARSASAVAVLSAAALVGPSVLLTQPAQAAESTGNRVLDKAETKTGHWYSYGSAGPTYFDCSGLVYWAAHQLGINIPRTTYGMLADTRHFYRIPVSEARRGDILFFGSGHEELDTRWYHTSFGAHKSGTRVGWRPWNAYYQPTEALRFR